MTDQGEIPQVGMHRTEDHRYYWNGVGPYANVTGIIDMLDKSDALVGWAKREVSSFAMRHLDALVAHRQHNYPVPECDPCAVNLARKYMVAQSEAARLWVSSIPDYIKDTAADLGTRVHTMAEKIAKGEVEDIAPDLLPYAAQYQRFRLERDFLPLAIEYMGLNRTHGFAGTGDILLLENRGAERPPVWAVDIKTHTKDTPLPKTYYPKTGMQLAACSRFEFIGKPGDPTEYPMPQVDAYAVLLLGREDYRLIPYAVTDRTFGAFLSCLDLYRWKNGEAQTIVGRVA